MTFHEISLEISRAVIGESVPDRELQRIVEDAFNFPIPVSGLESGLYVMELFHGPTLAFKDFGARFMARLMSYFNADEPDLTILVATSGDTGSAVAHGFFGLPGIRVVVLYPSGRISRIQEMQMATLGKNITALEVEGTFDDCQRIVKEAFLDPDLQANCRLTSANSINFARLLPQSFYYFYAWGKLAGKPVVISVPSGNFGNLTAGLLAKRMGLPIHRFVAATNCNDVVPQYLRSGGFHPRPSINTISNAMDVGNPSNFARMQSLYESELKEMQEDIPVLLFQTTKQNMRFPMFIRIRDYVLDPHGAVAYLGAQAYRASTPGQENIVFLETAHPAKFHEIVEPVIGVPVPIPERLRQCLDHPKLSIRIPAQLSSLKSLFS